MFYAYFGRLALDHCSPEGLDRFTEDCFDRAFFRLSDKWGYTFGKKYFSYSQQFREDKNWGQSAKIPGVAGPGPVPGESRRRRSTGVVA